MCRDVYPIAGDIHNAVIGFNFRAMGRFSCIFLESVSDMSSYMHLIAWWLVLRLHINMLRFLCIFEGLLANKVWLGNVSNNFVPIFR
jgi:hypothetical protein